MQTIATQSDRLYVLGDLFEVWIGDDCVNLTDGSATLYLDVIALFKNYADNQGELFFIHGNRDFLLSKDFEAATGGQLLEEPTFLSLAGQKVAIMHGDSLCTDDVSYQEFRTMVRNPHWQSEFLSLTIEKRLEVAMGLRQQSQQAQSEKTSEIMDVNSQQVVTFLEQHDIDTLIHGHTHRQASHTVQLNDRKAQRVVLSDWGKQGFYLSIDESTADEQIGNKAQNQTKHQTQNQTKNQAMTKAPLDISAIYFD
jgi:UDP-2,3-diacylglucosamine hydrolase